MRYGFVAPFGDARDIAELASLGEHAGWDGIFLAEALFGVDAWISLAAAAMVTKRIRLGTLLTPVSRVKPWDLASKVGTVDRLSRGRAVLSAGLGALHDGWLAFEPDEGRKTRAEKVDECLAVYAGLMAGQPFTFQGKHYTVRPTDFSLPDPPVQRPHPPVWMVGAQMLGRERQPSLDRAARWEGLIPQVVDVGAQRRKGGIEEFADITADVLARRTALGLPTDGFDVILEADSTGEFIQREPADPAAWAEAGATWWIECWWTLERGPGGMAELRRRIGDLHPPV